MVDGNAPGGILYSLIMGLDGFGSSVYHFLDRSGADGYAQYRMAKGFYHIPAIARYTGKLCDQCRKTGTVTGCKRLWDIAFIGFSAVGALAFIQNEVGDLHLNLRKFNVLVGVIRLRVFKLAASANALFGVHILDVGRVVKFLPVPFMTLFAAGLPLFRALVFLRLFKRRIG